MVEWTMLDFSSDPMLSSFGSLEHNFCAQHYAVLTLSTSARHQELCSDASLPRSGRHQNQPVPKIEILVSGGFLASPTLSPPAPSCRWPFKCAAGRVLPVVACGSSLSAAGRHMHAGQSCPARNSLRPARPGTAERVKHIFLHFR